MPSPPKQLPLELPVEARLEAEDFLVSPSNEAAYALIERWPDWPHRIVRLVGPEGSGKSHLAGRSRLNPPPNPEVAEPNHATPGGSS